MRAAHDDGSSATGSGAWGSMICLSGDVGGSSLGGASSSKATSASISAMFDLLTCTAAVMFCFGIGRIPTLFKLRICRLLRGADEGRFKSSKLYAAPPRRRFTGCLEVLWLDLFGEDLACPASKSLVLADRIIAGEAALLGSSAARSKSRASAALIGIARSFVLDDRTIVIEVASSVVVFDFCISFIHSLTRRSKAGQLLLKSRSPLDE